MRHLTTERCLICGHTTRESNSGPRRHLYQFDCEICGIFQATFEACINTNGIAAYDKGFLRCATRQASEFGTPLVLTTENIEKLPDQHRRTSISANLERLLSFMVKHAPRPSDAYTVSLHRDYPVIDALGPGELGWFIDYAVELGFCKVQDSSLDGRLTCLITPKGWAHLRGDTGLPIPGLCFVAMAFREDLAEAYRDGIHAAIEDDCGFDAVRMLELEHNDKICDRIIVEIRRAQFVVADFTHHRGGVYFEAGYAAALGRPVIWTCRDTDFDDLHFDTRQYNHIKWTSPEDLRASLAARIRATIPGARLAE